MNSRVFWPVGIVAILCLTSPLRSQAPFDSPAVSKPILTPDTPQNARLVEAIQRGDLAAVQNALQHGASADTRVEWYGNAGKSIPATLLAARSLPEDRNKFLPIFRVLIRHVSAVNAADEDTGRTLLIAAVDMDDLDSVKRLVEKGTDINARQKHWPAGANALAFAVMQGGVRSQKMTPITAYLLDHGAEINVPDENGTTPLMQAAGMNKTETVQALLARGADPAPRDNHGWTALRYAAARGWVDVVSVLRDQSPMNLYEAAEFGDVSRLRAHLDAGEDVNALDAQGATPLTAAMKSGNVEAVRFLLDRGADVNGKRRGGSTALHLAALYGDAALVSLLLDRGADVNTVVDKPPLIITPLTNAVRQAQVDVVALLLKRGADVRQDQGAAALQIAIQEAGSGVLRPRDAPMSRVLRGSAVYDARGRIIDLLLGAGVDARSDHSRALIVAANGGQAGLIELLLERGADVNARRPVGSDGSPDPGGTALMAAIDYWRGAWSDEHLMKIGVLSGLDIKDVRESQRFGTRSVELLLAHGADTNLADASGMTPLMQCVGSGLPTLAPMLLAHGANVNAADALGQTALIHAAAQNDRVLIALLLSHRADANIKDKSGRTALMMAVDDGSNDEYRAAQAQEASYPHPQGVFRVSVAQKDLPNPDGHPNAVRLLIQHGADVNAIAQDGTTALALARKQGFTEVEKILRQAGAKQ